MGGIKFANIPRVTKDARWIKMPYGDFLCKHYDVRSADFAKAQMKATRTHRTDIANATLDSAKDREISASIFVDISLVDWRGVKDESGEPVPFNRANAMALFADPDNSRVFYDVVDEASANANYRIDDDDRKN